MEPKKERNSHGIDCMIETHHDNGNARNQYEWNKDKTQTI
jgi:hypothetical protein